MCHAALHGLARIGQLLCHVGKGACETTELIFTGHDRFRRQVPRRHLADAIGQQEERTGNLVAQQYGQQHGTKHRQKQAERECADVHALQAIARQRTLLVLAVRLGDGDGVGHQGRGQRLGHHQIARFTLQFKPGAANGYQRLDTCVDNNGACDRGTAIFQPLNPRDEFLAACAAKLL